MMLHVEQSVTVRNTALVDFASCKQRYHMVWVRGIKPKVTDPKLKLGSMFHKFVEVFETEILKGDRDKAHLAGLDAMFKLYKEFKTKLATIPTATEDNATKTDAAYELAQGMAANYAAWRAIPEGELGTMLQAEAEFETFIGGLAGVKVILRGTADGIAADSDKNLWIREYKTCASIQDKLKQYPLDQQTRRYTLALRKMGINVLGVELILAAKSLPLKAEDMLLQKGGVSKDKSKWKRLSYQEALRLENSIDRTGKNGLTLEAFHDIIKVLKNRDNPFFRRELIEFNDVELARIRQETIMEGLEIAAVVEAEREMGQAVWTRNPGIMGFNCKTCPVRILCEKALKGVDISLIIAEHFDVVDPNAIPDREEDDEEETTEQGAEPAA